MNLRFTKMHALGNDFIVIDGIPTHRDGRDLELRGISKLSIRLCNRHFGIGADQMLILLKSNIADFRMRVFNADGGEVEMCGNGIRCIAKYIWDRGFSKKDILKIETLAGIISPEKAGSMVKVDMGKPILNGKQIPVNLNGRIIDYPLKIKAKIFNITCLSMGNPHAVIFVDDLSDFPVSYYGNMIENHQLFPKRTNVEFIEVIDKNNIKMRVWERGVGETMACGTGACASTVASSLKELTSKKITVHLLGGELFIEWADDGHVYMRGPAVEVFEGKIKINSSEGFHGNIGQNYKTETNP